MSCRLISSFLFSAVAVGCGGAGSSVPDAAQRGADMAKVIVPGGDTSLSGMLGALGAAKPTVASLVISNSGETLVYMSSAPMTCSQLQTSRWLGSIAAGAQVVEIVTKGIAKVGTIQVPPGEVNYGEGGKSSSYEVNAASGAVVYTVVNTDGSVEGTLSATYDDGSTLSGNFKAAFCAGGQGF